MKYILIFLLPVCLILLTAYSFYLNLEFSCWLALASFLISYGGMNGYVHLNSYQDFDEEVETYENNCNGKNEIVRVGISDSGNCEFLTCVHPNMNIYVEGFKSLMFFDKPNFIIIITNPIKPLYNDLSPTQ